MSYDKKWGNTYWRILGEMRKGKLNKKRWGKEGQWGDEEINKRSNRDGLKRVNKKSETVKKYRERAD